MTHLPILRWGVPYRSADVATSAGAQISQANGGLIRRDLMRAGTATAALQAVPMRRLIAMCEAAADLYRDATLPLGDGATQSPADYVRQVGDSCGLPHALVRGNIAKLHLALAEMGKVVHGLTRGIEPELIDAGMGVHAGVPTSFYRTSDVLGVVLPNNSPGVNSLWLPALAMKVPVALKPGREDPWTPWRLVQALIAAGVPACAFGYYPTGHEGAHAVLASCERALLFGDAAITKRYAGRPGVQIHGPGYSKVLIGADRIDGWRDLIDILAASVASNGGRSCVNASTIVVPRYGREIARALAERLAAIVPRAIDDAQAGLAGFAATAMPESIDRAITSGLKEPGAEDVSAAVRGPQRVVSAFGRHFVVPTVVFCRSFDHPLANREFLFPYCSVVEVPQAEMLDRIGPSLVVSAITDDAAWRRALLASPLVERLNLGAMATSTVRWDQPHEGNLFDLLYRRRAVQSAG